MGNALEDKPCGKANTCGRWRSKGLKGDARQKVAQELSGHHGSCLPRHPPEGAVGPLEAVVQGSCRVDRGSPPVRALPAAGVHD